MSDRKNSPQAVLERTSAEPLPPPAKPRPDRVQQRKAAREEGASFSRPSREGKKLIAGHFDPKVAKQLKHLAVEEDTSVEALLGEALDLLFVKKGKKAISRQ
jgi:hypothetical protein